MYSQALLVELFKEDTHQKNNKGILKRIICFCLRKIKILLDQETAALYAWAANQ